MASICKRGKKYSVIYYVMDATGKRQQKWISCKTLAEAKLKKKEIEYRLSIGNFVVPPCRRVNELLNEYIALYGKNAWALSTYTSNVSIIDHYIRPFIGDMKLSEVSTRVIERYYQQLLHTKAIPQASFGKSMKGQKEVMVSPRRVRDVHKILRNCFNQAVKWELMEKNPCLNASLPKAESKRRDIWTADILFQVLDSCDDGIFRLALNLTFACSLRMGELLALTWDCVDISPESIEGGYASIYIDKELQRVSRAALDSLENKDVIRIFPAASPNTSTIVVLKTPKTESSKRKIFVPKTVALMLDEWKKQQDEVKELLGDDYTDYNLVFTGSTGGPYSESAIRSSLKKVIKDNDLPPVVFHSFRHASITYKLKLNGGDIKAVQGDSGHSQAKMITDVYSHVLDEGRIRNAELFEDAFYRKKGLDVELEMDGDEDELVDSSEKWQYFSDARNKSGGGRVDASRTEQKAIRGQNGRKEKTGMANGQAGEVSPLAGVDPETLARLLSSPEFAALVKLLAGNNKQ